METCNPRIWRSTSVPARVACCLLLFGGVAAAQQYLISTVAGGAPPPASVAAAGAYVGQVLSVATDIAGNAYFVASYCVFKVDPSGVMTRVAGNGKPGYSGDGGPATVAQLFPSTNGLTVDGLGNIFVSDGSRIRRISPSGTITTVAGTGVGGYSGDGGPAASAHLDPAGVAVDGAGNLFFAAGNRVRKISTNGIISTVAGSGTAGYSGDGGPASGALLNSPYGLAIDPQGNLFIAEYGNSVIRKISPDGAITTVAGGGASSTGDGGPATSARLLGPIGLAADQQGNLLIAEQNASRIRRVSTGGIITTVAGSGSTNTSGDGSPTVTLSPRSVAVDPQGNIFIEDSLGRILKLSPDKILKTVAGRGTVGAAAGGPANSAQLGDASAVAVDAQGNLLIADSVASRVWQVSPSGTISTAAGTGVSGYSGDGGPATSAMLAAPRGVAVDSQGNIFVSDSINNRIRKISSGGIITTIAGTGKSGYSGDGGPASAAELPRPTNLTIDPKGNLFVFGALDFRIRKISADGVISTVAGTGAFGYSGDGGPAASAQLGYTETLAADAQGNLFIAELDNQRIRKISTDGIITTIAGNGKPGLSGDGGLAVNAQLYNPAAIAVDGPGNLYFADSARIRKISVAGIITTVAGTYLQSYSGDGGPAANAQFVQPDVMTVDRQGNLFVSESFGAAVRRLQPTNRSVLLAAVVDAASQNAGPLSPGKIVVLYGGGLGPVTLSQNHPANGIYSTQLSGTTVSFNGTAAPIVYASATQVAAIVPYGVSGATAQVTVTYQGETSPAIILPLAAAAPSLFTLNQTGAGQAAAINAADGSINTAAAPVKIGGYLSLFATGEGQTTPGGIDGGLASGATLAQPNQAVTVTIGGLPALVQYAGAAPGQVAGLMQINVQIPAGVSIGGYVPVLLHVGNSTIAADAVWIAVTN